MAVLWLSSVVRLSLAPRQLRRLYRRRTTDAAHCGSHVDLTSVSHRHEATHQLFGKILIRLPDVAFRPA